MQMKEYKYILLDLDGTITDPMIGITRCVEYALNHFGIQVNDLRELCPFIGPPLLDSFRDFYHFTDEQAKEATEKYRERFADTGIYENKLYDGMKDFLEEATRQGRILMLALPPFALQNMFQSFFVTAEKPHLGFYFTVGAGCTNMVLDVLMVGVWGWGVEGAAIATFISQLVGGVLPVFYFIDHSNTSRLHLCKTKVYGSVLRDACINGSSELMTNLSMSLVNILYNYQLLRLGGEDGVAAYGVIMYAAFLFVAVFVGYAVGSAPIVSFHYGARNHAEVHNLYQKSLRLIAVVAVSMTAVSMVLIPYVARIFVGYDAQLLALTNRAFRLYALSFLIMGFNVYASSFFTALGDGVTSALISFLRTLVFQLAALLLLPALWGIDGVWLAVTAAELAALAVSVYMFVTKDQKFHYRHG